VNPFATFGKPRGVEVVSKPDSSSIDRRSFLTAATTGTVAAGGHGHAHAQDNHQDVPSDPALRVRALESLLVEKGIVDPAALDALVDVHENQVGPRNGARVVARAWVDPDFKARLLEDGTAAIAEFGSPTD
jgi:hypothetical protein